MHELSLGGRKLRRILCLGAHCDDIEIGCGGTLLQILAASPGVEVDWVVFTGSPERAAETRAAAAEFLAGAGRSSVTIQAFTDGSLPAELGTLKACFRNEIARQPVPDLVLTHFRGDFHQDHRTIAELTWQTFRDQLIWEYEIPKYDGDLGRPNVYVPLDEALLRRKVDILQKHFDTQRGKAWFSADTFLALSRLRGVEAGGSCIYAEAFHSTKSVIRP